MTYTVTETTTDGQPVYILTADGEPICQSQHEADVVWFADLLNEAPYFLTGPVAA